MLNPYKVSLSEYKAREPNPYNGGAADPQLVDGFESGVNFVSPITIPTEEQKKPPFYPYNDPSKKFAKHVGLAATVVVVGLGAYFARSHDSLPQDQTTTPTSTTIFPSPTPSATPLYFQ